jgi:hypothetical protein
MGLIDRIKSSYVYTQWKMGRYTRRRRSLMPEFDERSAEFYERNYRNGEYLHQEAERRQMSYDLLGTASVAEFTGSRLAAGRSRFSTSNMGAPIDEQNEATSEQKAVSYRFGDEPEHYYETISSLPPIRSSTSKSSYRNSMPPAPLSQRAKTWQADRSSYVFGASKSPKVDTSSQQGAVVPYNDHTTAYTPKNNPFYNDMETQRGFDEEFYHDTLRSRRRRTMHGSEIRCSEAYNMVW